MKALERSSSIKREILLPHMQPKEDENLSKV